MDQDPEVRPSPIVMRRALSTGHSMDRMGALRSPAVRAVGRPLSRPASYDRSLDQLARSTSHSFPLFTSSARSSRTSSARDSPVPWYLDDSPNNESRTMSPLPERPNTPKEWDSTTDDDTKDSLDSDILPPPRPKPRRVLQPLVMPRVGSGLELA